MATAGGGWRRQLLMGSLEWPLRVGITPTVPRQNLFTARATQYAAYIHNYSLFLRHRHDACLRSQHVHQITARQEVEQKVQVVWALQRRVLADAERMTQSARDALLLLQVVRALQRRALADRLKRIAAACTYQ